MKEIRMEKYDSSIHCIKCGTQTSSSISNFINEGSINICPHLIYLGNGIIPFDVNTKNMYCKFFDKLCEIGGDFLQILREEVDDEHLILNIASPISVLERYFIVYNLGDLSKEKAYFNGDKDCKYWDVWGPTLQKYGVHRGQETQK